jgi:hypothetical protein
MVWTPGDRHHIGDLAASLPGKHHWNFIGLVYDKANLTYI